MEIILVVFSAISALSTTTLAVILFQTQSSLNANAKKQAEANGNFSKQIERLLQRNQALEQRLFELLQQSEESHTQNIQVLVNKLIEQFSTQGQATEKLHRLLQQSGESQTQNMQMLASKLEALKNSLEESIKF